MTNGEIVTVRRAHGCGLYRADAALALRLPELRLPRMQDEARAAFRAVLDYEQPPSNGSLEDFLRLAEARGFCAHPCDWIPSFNDDPHQIALYQPWVDWLSENGVTPFHSGNKLTKENWPLWKPKSRAKAFDRLFKNDPQFALELVTALGATLPSADRQALLEAIGYTGWYSGVSPRQFEVVKYFLGDRLERIRTAAAGMVAKSQVLEAEDVSAEDLATELAMHIAVSDASVKYKTPVAPHLKPFGARHERTTFDVLAKALRLSAQDLAQRCDFEDLGAHFMAMMYRTADVEARSLIAARLLDQNKAVHFALFKGVARPLWERGLRATFKSHYFSEVGEFLGIESGTLDASAMRELACFQFLDRSVTNELETGKLPVNGMYDPLRALALVVDKDAAKSALERAFSLGMKEDNPRLTMLKCNMAL